MEYDYERIEKYLQGELTVEELAIFEQELKTNTTFKEKVDLYSQANSLLARKYANINAENSLKKTLQSIDNKEFNKTKINEKRWLKPANLYRITALAAVLIIGIFLLKPEADLYTQFAQHENIAIQEKGDNNQFLFEAVNLYNHKKYDEAIPKIEDFLRENPEDTELQMALGISLLETDKVEDAILVFTHIYDENNVFKSKATWYLALSNVKLEEKSRAIAYLNAIETSSYYYPQAAKLLKKLN